ncbi:hypothetical protein [Acinetobacter baumannii]|uniref:hypothetical protein n=1 Tax=Acinetobacter baumannii TaxID=470 RepID=UPI000BF7CE3B|nr:hypothetical protein [Acinetobacter baumannii]
MKEEFKYIFLYGGLGWGVPFAFLMYIVREIEGKPMAFGSLSVFLSICILGGLFFGTMIFKFASNKKSDN